MLYNYVTFLNKRMTTSTSRYVTTEYGKQNMFAYEPPIQVIQSNKTMNEQAELVNGRWAMIGIIAALGAYATTGQILPGVF